MKTVYVLGRGPSIETLEFKPEDDVRDVILMNDHSRTIANPRLLERLQDKNIYVMCNINQAGFVPGVLEKISVKGCLTNRFKPDWEVWRQEKEAQTKHYEGGTLNNLGLLPYLAEDEPYVYTWRGPEGRNHEEMTTYNGRKIEHMPEEAEQYLLDVYREKLVCNCSYYGTLYAIIKLKAERVIYYGVDFYDNLKIEKKWYLDPPAYLTDEWTRLRIAYEGAHMKILWDEYLCDYFPQVTFEFNTAATLSHQSPNLIVNKIEQSSISQESSMYY